MRLKPKLAPFQKPHSRMASIIYCEHVGVYRQALGKYGDSTAWYKRTKAINKPEKSFPIMIMVEYTPIAEFRLPSNRVVLMQLAQFGYLVGRQYNGWLAYPLHNCTNTSLPLF